LPLDLTDTLDVLLLVIDWLDEELALVTDCLTTLLDDEEENEADELLEKEAEVEEEDLLAPEALSTAVAPDTWTC
jgi:hypothetical protein